MDIYLVISKLTLLRSNWYAEFANQSTNCIPENVKIRKFNMLNNLIKTNIHDCKSIVRDTFVYHWLQNNYIIACTKASKSTEIVFKEKDNEAVVEWVVNR